MTSIRLLAVTAALMLAVLWAWPAGVLADDVIVNTIKPDIPPVTSQPGQTSETPGKVSEPGVDQPRTPQIVPSEYGMVTSGESVVRSSVNGLKLTDDQKTRIQPLLDAAAKDASAIRDIKDPKERAAAMDKQRDDLLAQVLPLLTEPQARKLKMDVKLSGLGAGVAHGYTIDKSGNVKFLGQQEGDPANQAERWLVQYTGGFDLPADVRTKLMDTLRPLADQHLQKQLDYYKATAPLNARLMKNRNDEQASKESETLWAKNRAQEAAAIKTVREAVNKALTLEQQQAASADRRQSRLDVVDAYVAKHQTVVDSWTDLTNEQKQKAKDWLAAAREAMQKLAGDEDDWVAQFAGLKAQLNKDFLALFESVRKK